MVTVEQGHCTLAAVKRYWDTSCVGGRHNFFQRPTVTKTKTRESKRTHRRQIFFPACPKPGLQTFAPSKKTHNTEPRTLRLNDPSEYFQPLTWPGREIDQKGSTPSVEQGHCTLIAVKRYRDPPRIGGRHNFLLRPYGPHYK